MTTPEQPADPESGEAGLDGDLHRAGGVTEWLVLVANFVAPVTVVTSLLLYFGYVGTRARLEYFGVYLDMANLSNLDLVLYGMEVIYFPAAMVFLALFVGAVLHGAMTWLLTSPGRDTTSLAIAALTATLGVLAIGRATVGIFSVDVSRTEVPGTTPLALALGPVLVAYGAWIGRQVSRRQAVAAGSGTRLLDWFGGPRTKRTRQVALAGVGGLLVAGLFWAANSFAWAYGSGRAYDDAMYLPDRPEVVVDTRERLVDPPPGVGETLLGPAPARTVSPGTVSPGPAPAGTVSADPAEGAAFRYRYTGLRLLLEADGRLFLVPAGWTSQSRTLVLPYDQDVRVQLVPRR
jgi:hypothetical protein